MDKFLLKSKRVLDSETSSSVPSSGNSKERCESKRKATELVEPPSSSKKKRMCRYRVEYTEEFPFIKRGLKGENFVFCEHCRSDLSISSGGRDDITRHLTSIKHLESVKAYLSASKPKPLSHFFPKSYDETVIRAEVLFTKFLMDNNLPMSVSDKFNKLVSTIFPDSDIATKYQCGRTKATAIVHTLAHSSMTTLGDLLKNTVFSLSTDGSNKNDLKLYPIVIRVFDVNEGSIKTKLLCLPELKSPSTAVNIKELILNQLLKFKIPYRNCIAFSADNCNVMVGKHGGVSTLLKSDIPELIVIGCPCHLINLCAKKAAKVLPANIEELLVDVFYFFKHSEKRQAELAEFQTLYNDDVKKILKYCPTRWLSLSPCLKRLLELWQPLYKYCSDLVKKASEKENKKKLKEKEKIPAEDAIISSWFQDGATSDVARENQNDSQNSRLSRLHSFLSSKRNLIYCAFVMRVVPSFEKANVALQSEAPVIFQTRGILLGLFRDMLLRLVKPSVLKKSDILKIEYRLEENHLKDKDLDLGSLANNLMENLNSKARAEIFNFAKEFFMKALDYMKANFPFQCEVLIQAANLDLRKRENWEFSSIKFFACRFKSLDLLKDEDSLRDEFMRFRSYSFPPEIENESRVDIQLSKLSLVRSEFDNTVMFPTLCKLLLAVLCIPHSNADSERIFSVVRKNLTESRASMSTQTLESLLVSKLNLSADSSTLDEEILKKCKKATREHLASSQDY